MQDRQQTDDQCDNHYRRLLHLVCEPNKQYKKPYPGSRLFIQSNLLIFEQNDVKPQAAGLVYSVALHPFACKILDMQPPVLLLSTMPLQQSNCHYIQFSVPSSTNNSVYSTVTQTQFLCQNLPLTG